MTHSLHAITLGDLKKKKKIVNTQSKTAMAIFSEGKGTSCVIIKIDAVGGGGELENGKYAASQQKGCQGQGHAVLSLKAQPRAGIACHSVSRVAGATHWLLICRCSLWTWLLRTGLGLHPAASGKTLARLLMGRIWKDIFPLPTPWLLNLATEKQNGPQGHKGR